MRSSSLPGWAAFSTADLVAAQAAGDQLYHEFLRVPALSMGLYVLGPGAVDPQQPHTEDEVYVVISGRGQIRLEDADQSVAPGDVIFVGAHLPHHFHDIQEELRLLVLFAPAES